MDWIYHLAGLDPDVAAQCRQRFVLLAVMAGMVLVSLSLCATFSIWYALNLSGVGAFPSAFFAFSMGFIVFNLYRVSINLAHWPRVSPADEGSAQRKPYLVGSFFRLLLITGFALLSAMPLQLWWFRSNLDARLKGDLDDIIAEETARYKSKQAAEFQSMMAQEKEVEAKIEEENQHIEKLNRDPANTYLYVAVLRDKVAVWNAELTGLRQKREERMAEMEKEWKQTIEALKIQHSGVSFFHYLQLLQKHHPECWYWTALFAFTALLPVFWKSFIGNMGNAEYELKTHDLDVATIKDQYKEFKNHYRLEFEKRYKASVKWHEHHEDPPFNERPLQEKRSFGDAEHLTDALSRLFHKTNNGGGISVETESEFPTDAHKGADPTANTPDAPHSVSDNDLIE